jgi:single-strand DNA-binding protein
MVNLNSVLIEGILTAKPKFYKIQEETSCVFEIINLSCQKKQDKIVYSKNYVTIESYGTIAENVNKIHAGKGRGVRVVGRIKQEFLKGPDGKSQSNITVFAEHIEFKNEAFDDSIPKLFYGKEDIVKKI